MFLSTGPAALNETEVTFSEQNINCVIFAFPFRRRAVNDKIFLRHRSPLVRVIQALIKNSKFGQKILGSVEIIAHLSILHGVIK